MIERIIDFFLKGYLVRSPETQKKVILYICISFASMFACIVMSFVYIYLQRSIWYILMFPAAVLIIAVLLLILKSGRYRLSSDLMIVFFLIYGTILLCLDPYDDIFDVYRYSFFSIIFIFISGLLFAGIKDIILTTITAVICVLCFYTYRYHFEFHRFSDRISLISLGVCIFFNLFAGILGILSIYATNVSTHIQKLALFDPLTGIFNRYSLTKLLNMEIKKAERYDLAFSVTLFDIDDYKMINDTCGHQAGDNILKELTLLIGNSIRSTDIFARWGGDEFIIVFPGTDGIAASSIVTKIMAIISAGRFSNECRLTCSFGIAEYMQKDTIESLIRRADSGLYDSKHNGKNRYTVYHG